MFQQKNAKGAVKMKRTTIRMSEELFKKMRIKNITEDISVNDYIVALIEKDIEKDAQKENE